MGPFTGGWTEADVEAVLARGIPEELLYIPIVVGMNADCVEREWAEKMCLALANHKDIQVRCNALMGFGHIARVCGEVTSETVFPVLSEALVDPSEKVRGYALDAACDIHHYVGDVVPGYDVSHTEAHLEALSEALEKAKKQSRPH